MIPRAVHAVVWLAVALMAWSPEVWALCPNCLGQTRTLTPTLELLGIFLLVPFAVAYVVFRVIRRVCRDSPGPARRF